MFKMTTSQHQLQITVKVLRTVHEPVKPSTNVRQEYNTLSAIYIYIYYAREVK